MILEALLWLGTISCLNGELIDMTHAFSNESTIYWPESGRWNFQEFVVFKGFTESGIWYEVSNMKACEHGGTHIDAPTHFARGGWAIGDIPLKNLVGPAVRIDVTKQSEENRDYAMTENDVVEHEKEYGRIPSGAIVFVYSGWGKYYDDKNAYLGKEGPIDNYDDLHFPGVGGDATKLLLKRGMVGLVVETASFDIGQSKTFESHVLTAEKNVWGIESAANVDLLPPRGATVYVAPMKIKKGSGAPVRIYAQWGDISSANHIEASSKIAILAFVLILTLGQLL